MGKALTIIHPSEIPKDALSELGISGAQLARQIEVSRNRGSQILWGRRATTSNTAPRLARRFGAWTKPWMNPKQTYELGYVWQRISATMTSLPPHPPIPARLSIL
jgi:addiction module HigA family antidote